MHTPTPSQAGFKRQVVFRIDADDWPLLEAAAREHGSIQAAVLAGLRALAAGVTEPDPQPGAAASHARERKPVTTPRTRKAAGEQAAIDSPAAKVAGRPDGGDQHS